MSRGFDDSDLLVARERDPERRRRLRRNVIACLRLAWHASPSGFVTTIVVSFLTSLIPPGVVWLGKHLVDLVAAAAVRPIAFSEVLPTVVGLGLLAGSQRALNQFESRRQRINSERVRREAERRFLAHVSRVDLGHFDNSDWHDRVARAKRDLSWRMFNLTNTVVALGGSVVTLLGMLGVLLTLHPLLAVLSLASVIPDLKSVV